MNRAKNEDVLLAMGVPTRIKGFTYIADAIQIFDERGTGIGITKELYPAIAKKNGATPSRVERAIRHAFEVARSCKGDYEVVNHYIGFINCENSASLKMLHKRIRQECEENESVLENSKESTDKEGFSEELRKVIREELAMFFGRLGGTKT